MRSLSLSFFALMLAVVLTSASAYSATGTPGGFEHLKADQLNRLDSRIKQLEDEKTCRAQATNREVSKVYRELGQQRNQGRYNWEIRPEAIVKEAGLSG